MPPRAGREASKVGCSEVKKCSTFLHVRVQDLILFSACLVACPPESSPYSHPSEVMVIISSNMHTRYSNPRPLHVPQCQTSA